MSTIGAIELEHPIMNAAGTCKTVDEVRRFAAASVAAVMVGSITREPRDQNEGTTYWSNSGGSLRVDLGYTQRDADDMDASFYEKWKEPPTTVFSWARAILRVFAS